MQMDQAKQVSDSDKTDELLKRKIMAMTDEEVSFSVFLFTFTRSSTSFTVLPFFSLYPLLAYSRSPHN